jgi:hypothetical protein
MSTDLETRLQSMGGAIRDAVADVPDRSPRRPGGGARRVAVGVPLLVVAVGAALFIVKPDDSKSVDQQNVSSLSGLVADATDLPAGLQVSWAGQQDANHVDAGAGAADGAVGAGTDSKVGPVQLYTYLYGDTHSPLDPFAQTDLVVNVWELPTGATAFDPATAIAGLPGAVQTTVGSQSGVAVDATSAAAAGGEAVNSLRWQTVGGVEALLASHNLSIDQLKQIATGMQIQGTNVTLGTLPAGLSGKLESVGQLKDKVVNGARQVAAHWVGYADTTVSGAAGKATATATRAVDITTVLGDTDELQALVWGLQGTVEQVDVRGSQGWIATEASGSAKGTVELVWEEQDGVLAHVTSVGLSKDEVLALVHQLHWAAKSEWTKVTGEAASVAADAKQAAQDVLTGATTVPDDGTVTAQADKATETAGKAVDNAKKTVGDTKDKVEGAAGTALGQLESTLHQVPGADAVLGPVTNAVNKAGGDLKNAADKLTPTTQPGGGGLLP